jgi:hypothetical protein
MKTILNDILHQVWSRLVQVILTLLHAQTWAWKSEAVIGELGSTSDISKKADETQRLEQNSTLRTHF